MSHLSLYLAWIGSIFLVLLTAFYLYLREKYTYWKKLGVKGPKPLMFFGNLKDVLMLKMTESQQFRQFYNEFQDEPYIGLYFMWKPMLLVRDEELLKKITIKDFQSFTDHPQVADVDKTTDGVFKSLFFMKGNIWKERRQLFSRLFSPKQLKLKMDTFKSFFKKTKNDVGTLVDTDKDIDIEEHLLKFALRALTSTLMSIDVSEDSEEKNFEKCSDLFARPPLSTVVKSLTYSLMPSIYRLFHTPTFPLFMWSHFSKFTKAIVGMREKNVLDRDDLLSLILKMKKEGLPSGSEIDFREMVGHMFSFFVAGHHTTALTMCHVLVQLSLHPQVQTKLCNEIEEVHQDEKEITYDSLKKMTYLDNVIAETLRLFPVVGGLKRVCTEEYKIDDNFTIPKDLEIIIPAEALHYDPKYFKDPDVFIPERFSEEEPFVYMPFGRGPRICVGMRFAEVEMKYILAVMLSLYEILPSNKMKLPIVLDPRTVIVSNRSVHGFWIKLKQRENPLFDL